MTQDKTIMSNAKLTIRNTIYTHEHKQEEEEKKKTLH